MSLEIIKLINCIVYGFLSVFILNNIGSEEDFVEFSRKRWIAIILTAVSFIFIANYLVPLSIKMVVIILMQFVICQIMYNISFTKKIIKVIITITITSLTDTIISLLFTFILNINMINLLDNIYYYILYNLLNISFTIIFIMLIKTKKIMLLDNDNVSKRNKYLLYTIIVLQFLRVFVEFFLIYYIARIPNLHTNLQYVSVTSYVCSIFSIGLLIYSANVIIDKENLIKISNDYSEKLNVYNDVLQNSIENQRKIAHEHGNQLTVLSGYISNSDIEKARNYLSKIIGTGNIDNEYLSRIRESGLRALMIFKVAMMEKKNIEFATIIDEDLEDTIIPSEDICNIMGVFLDNAIEAASQSEEPFISLSIFKNEYSLNISIINSIKDSNIDTKRIFKKGYSSKGEGRGYGLHIVDEIVKKYEELDLLTRVEDELFIQELRVTDKSISLTKN